MTLSEEHRAMLLGLPGEDLVLKGFADLARGDAETSEALLVLMGAPRLIACGFTGLTEAARNAPSDLELRFYGGLVKSGDLDPYGRYNSLRGRLASFLSALEGRVRRGTPPSGPPLPEDRLR